MPWKYVLQFTSAVQEPLTTLDFFGPCELLPGGAMMLPAPSCKEAAGLLSSATYNGKVKVHRKAAREHDNKHAAFVISVTDSTQAHTCIL